MLTIEFFSINIYDLTAHYDNVLIK